MSLSHPTRPNYAKLGALAPRSCGTDESMPLPPLIKPAHNTNTAASNHVSRSTWKAAGCHSPQAPRRLFCVMSASSVGEKGANYVDRVSNWMRWQTEREESGSSEVNQGTSDWSIASNSSLSCPPKSRLGSNGSTVCLWKMLQLKPSIWRRESLQKTPTEWQILRVKWSSIVAFVFIYFFLSKKTEQNTNVLCDPFAFPLLAMGGRAMMMVEHCDPILFYLSWQLHAQHSPWECSSGCCH